MTRLHETVRSWARSRGQHRRATHEPAGRGRRPLSGCGHCFAVVWAGPDRGSAAGRGWPFVGRSSRWRRGCGVAGPGSGGRPSQASRVGVGASVNGQGAAQALRDCRKARQQQATAGNAIDPRRHGPALPDKSWLARARHTEKIPAQAIAWPCENPERPAQSRDMLQPRDLATPLTARPVAAYARTRHGHRGPSMSMHTTKYSLFNRHRPHSAPPWTTASDPI